jgi:hypothetical protein
LAARGLALVDFADFATPKGERSQIRPRTLAKNADQER